MKNDRLISLNAAIDALEKCTDIYLNSLPPTIYKEDAIKAVKALPPAQPGWIPCSVMLPENDGVYLVTLRAITQLQKACEKIDIARFDGKWHKAYPVVAWMPLPPLPPLWERRQNG